MPDQSPYHNRLDIPIRLACGCETTWHDGWDLWQVGQYAYCQEHGDTEISEICATPNQAEDKETA